MSNHRGSMHDGSTTRMGRFWNLQSLGRRTLRPRPYTRPKQSNTDPAGTTQNRAPGILQLHTTTPNAFPGANINDAPTQWHFLPR